MAEEMSNGRLQIRIDSANKHKAPLGVSDMVKSGQYDMGHSASYYWKGKVPNTLYFTSMPFGMLPTEQYAWFYYGGGMELMEKVYDEEYQFEYINKIEEKYGKSSFDFQETNGLDENGDPYYTMVEIFEEDYTQEELAVIEEEKTEAMWAARAKQAKAHKLLWNYIEHNIRNWWD